MANEISSININGEKYNFKDHEIRQSVLELSNNLSDCVTLNYLSNTLSDYVTVNQLSDTLSDCITINQLSDTLSDYVTHNDMSGYVTSDDISGYVTSDDLSSYDNDLSFKLENATFYRFNRLTSNNYIYNLKNKCINILQLTASTPISILLPDLSSSDIYNINQYARDCILRLECSMNTSVPEVTFTTISEDVEFEPSLTAIQIDKGVNILTFTETYRGQ